MTYSGDNIQESKNVLVMLSGGRDSFLATCRLIEQGYHAYMVTYDNGCMSNIKAVTQVAKRIIKKYGASRASFIGIYSMTTYLYRLLETYLYKTASESSKQYPDLIPAQLRCLACRTGMYIEAIVYCKTHNIQCIAEGARKVQKFIVELPEMIERYKMLTQKNEIELILPVYEFSNDWERKLELADRGYIPKTLEPQCWLGCPLRQELNSSEIKSLVNYYDNEIEYKLQKIINDKVAMYSFEENYTIEGGLKNYNEV